MCENNDEGIMKFIELTDTNTNRKVLVNLDKVRSVGEGSKTRFSRIKDTIIDFGYDEYLLVEEEYETIKEIIEGMQ